MPKQKVEALVEGGKASAGPPVGPALGPLGVNIGQVIAEINKKTTNFSGIQVPVKIIIDTKTKSFEIEVGTPPASALIFKEAQIEKGSANPLVDKVADVKIEQIIKIAKMKESALLGKTLKEKVKEIIGTCNSLGVLVEGKPAVDTIKDINTGKFDEEIRTEKTQLTAAELRELEEERKRLAAEMEKRRAEFIAKAKAIIEEMAGKERGVIKGRLSQGGIPAKIIEELLPTEGAAAAAEAAPKEAVEKAAEKEAPAEKEKKTSEKEKK